MLHVHHIIFVCSFQSELLLSVAILLYCFRFMWLVKHWKHLLYECCSAVFVKLVYSFIPFLIVCTAHSAYKNVVLFRSHTFICNKFVDSGNQVFCSGSPFSILLQPIFV